MFSQIDLYASLADLTKQKIKDGDAPDSKNSLTTLLNTNPKSRDFIVEQSVNSTLSLIVGDWKFIEPSNGPAMSKQTNTELGNSKSPQLYNLKKDLGETRNVAATMPDKVKEMSDLLVKIRAQR